MKNSVDDTKDLAKCFREVSVSLGNYRFNNWIKLSDQDRSSIEGMEWTLLNYSSDFITQAVGLILDDAKANLSQIQRAMDRANKAISKIRTVKKVFAIGASAAGLGAAIVVAAVTKDPGSIGAALGNLLETIKKDSEDKKKV